MEDDLFNYFFPILWFCCSCHSSKKKKLTFPFTFHSFFPFTLPSKRRSYFVSAKKEMDFFVLRSTFRNYGRIRRISLYKGDAED